MFEKIKKIAEMIKEVNSRLNGTRTFLIGNMPSDNESTTCKEAECLDDELNLILNDLDYSLVQTKIIEETIKGGSK